MTLAGKRALVTGASGGIGGAFARQLAARGATLVLTGRNEDKLRALATELEQAHGSEVAWIAADLAQPAGPRLLFDQTEGANRPVEILVNNAGVAFFSDFADESWERIAAELQLNVTGVTELCYRFGRAMRARRRGTILNVASIGSYTAAPHLATYGAGKAYVLSLTEALAHELRPAGVRVFCVCPGATRTGWWENAGRKAPKSLAVRATMGSAEDVARAGLRALNGRSHAVLVGGGTRLGVLLMRLVPRRVVTAISARVIHEGS